MTKLEQAARQALEALEQNTYYNFDDDIKALREALAEQAEQRSDSERMEPVGYTAQSVIDWLSSDERTEGAYSSINLYKNPCGSSDAPIYSAPVQQITRADLKAAFKEGFERAADLYAPKDVQEQAEQEPVAEVRVRALRGNESVPKIDVEWLVRPTPGFLYAAPVRTKDLTDDEIMKINVDTASIVPTCDRQFHFARAVISADREKNK